MSNTKHQTKSNKVKTYGSSMKRDDDTDKPHFEYLLPSNVAYKDQLLTRWAELMQRGAIKYGSRNYENAHTPEELERYKSSAMRHFMQWMCDEDDEDHAVAVMFNLMCAEMIKNKEKTDDRSV